MSPPRVAVLVERLGPYHAARFAAVARRTDALDLTVLEIAAGSTRYAWSGGEAASFRTHPLFPGADYLALRPAELRRATRAALAELRPAVVVANGWGFPESRAAIAWAAANGRPAAIFSDSHERDAPRVAWREALKRGVVGACAAALVAGRRHAEYLARLGMPADRIVTGYDVVDNAHFASGAAAARADAPALRARLGLPARYFLASARFIAKKNLPALVDAYAGYRAAAQAPWGLVLLGDGEERAALEAAIDRHHLADAVRLPGFVQYPELPAWFGLASAFVLPSTHEQWGLVVNEAAAAGLPLVVSERAGCAPELVRDGENGFLFDPSRPGELGERLQRMAALPDAALAVMGEASRRLVAALTPETFAEALVRTVALARERGPASAFSLARWLP
ncbi:MAG: glycosyltransferase [Anaeromyxobacteraceae bacterium]